MSARSAKTQAAVSPVYLVGGPDLFLADQQIRDLVDHLLSPDQRQLAFWQPPEENLPEVAEILDELRTLPFLASRRVVLIKNAENFISGNREHLEKYLENPSPTGVLILQVGKVDSRTRLSKSVMKLGGVIETGQMKPHEIPKFASGYCQQHFGKALNHSAAQMLVQFVGDETGRICSEIEKLVTFVGEKKSITPDDVQALVGQNRMFDAFEVIDAMMNHRIEEALRRIRKMFETDRSTEYTVIGAFAYHFRRLFSAKAALEKGQSQQQAARKAGIPSFIQDRFFAQLRLVTLVQLGKIMARLGEMDFMVKTGQTTAPSAMERLIVRIDLLFSPH